MRRIATHCELVDRLFSNGQNVYRAEVVTVCFVIIFKIYKLASNQTCIRSKTWKIEGGKRVLRMNSKAIVSLNTTVFHGGRSSQTFYLSKSSNTTI